ncbi:MAG: T9SS type A sorting domain-containing protein, partial [Ignavibacteriaceae bacterium]|nr:T9SS type A sorting domain-containing protein [Ignavibacteriaceae bacterium]
PVWEKIGFVNGNGNSNSPKDYLFVDKNFIGGSKFNYRLKQIDNDGQFEYSEMVEVQVVPNKFELYQNYPNPFNPSTKIRYQLPNESKVVIKIYNILGSEVMELVNSKKEAGVYEAEFNAASLSSGTYIYKISADNFVQTKKMILLK